MIRPICPLPQTVISWQFWEGRRIVLLCEGFQSTLACFECFFCWHSHVQQWSWLPIENLKTTSRMSHLTAKRYKCFPLHLGKCFKEIVQILYIRKHYTVWKGSKCEFYELCCGPLKDNLLNDWSSYSFIFCVSFPHICLCLFPISACCWFLAVKLSSIWPRQRNTFMFVFHQCSSIFFFWSGAQTLCIVFIFSIK